MDRLLVIGGSLHDQNHFKWHQYTYKGIGFKGWELTCRSLARFAVELYTTHHT